jgi:hypothetical protein
VRRELRGGRKIARMAEVDAVGQQYVVVRQLGAEAELFQLRGTDPLGEAHDIWLEEPGVAADVAGDSRGCGHDVVQVAAATVGVLGRR